MKKMPCAYVDKHIHNTFLPLEQLTSKFLKFFRLFSKVNFNIIYACYFELQLIVISLHDV